MKTSKPFFSVLLLSLLWANLTRAYLEPGASSFFLKILISTLAGFVFVFRYIWIGVRRLFGGDKPSENKEKKDGERKT